MPFFIVHVYHEAVWLYYREAAPPYYLKSPLDKMTSNIAHGGSENKILYIVEPARSTIAHMILPVAGQTIFART